MFKKSLLILLFLSSFIFAESINVGVSDSYKPFCYVDNSGKPAGFDVEVLQALKEYDKSLEFNFIPTTWASLFLGLDSARFKILAYQINKTPERERKYIFSNSPYFYGTSTLVVKENSKITSMNDLDDKKIGVGLGDIHSMVLENFLKENKQINAKIIYYKNSPQQIADLDSGRIDAIIDDPIAIVETAQNLGVKLKATNEVLDKQPVYFVFLKKDEDLKNRVSNALDSMIVQGKLKELSIKYFKKDYTSF